MKKPKRHLLIAIILLAIVLGGYILKLIGWKIEIILLLALFPYISFSLIFSNIKITKKKKAIDVIGRRYLNQ